MKTIEIRRALVLVLVALAPLFASSRAVSWAQETTHIEESDLPERSDAVATGDDGAGARVEDGLDRAGAATHHGVEHGVEPVGRGLEQAMEATGRGLRKAIEKTGEALRRAGNALDGRSGGE